MQCAHFKYEFNNRHLACQVNGKREIAHDPQWDMCVCGFVGADVVYGKDSSKTHLRATFEWKNKHFYTTEK